MADNPANLREWSTTTSSNSPTDATTIGAGLADVLQEIQGVVRRDLASVGANIASSANPDVAAVQGLYHTVTGNATIVGLGSTAATGIWKILEFSGSPVLKHSTALAMVTAADVTAQPGAVGVFFCEASNQWRNVSFHRATAGALVAAATTTQAGVMEVATASEALAGTSDTVAITPSALDAVLGMVKLASGTASNTSVADITMTAYTAYANKMLVLRNFVPATSSGLSLLVSTDGGANYLNSSYRYAVSEVHPSGATFALTASSSSTTSAALSSGGPTQSTASGGINGVIRFFHTTDATKHPAFNFAFQFVDGGGSARSNNGSGFRLGLEDTDAVRLQFNIGNIGIGDWDLYGFN